MITRTFFRNTTLALFSAICIGACFPEPKCNMQPIELSNCQSDDECPAGEICVGLFPNCSAAKVCNSQMDCESDEICTSRLALFSGEITRTTCEPNPNIPPDGGSVTTGNGGSGGASSGQGGMGGHGGQSSSSGQGGAGGASGQSSGGGQAGSAGQGGVGGMNGQGGTGG